MNLENGRLNRRNFLKILGDAVAANLVDVSNEAMVFEKGNFTPTRESIIATFTEILKGQEAKEIRRAEDENEVYLWEIELPDEDGTVELNFMRKGKYEVGGFNSATKIYVTFFDLEGIPVGGHDVAEFIDGKWFVTE